MLAAAETLEEVELDRPIIDPRTVPVRFSRLKYMSQSALHYWQAVQDDEDDSLARRLGSGVHAMLLGMPVALFDKPAKKGKGKAPRNGEVWEEFQKEHAGEVILIASEWAAAQAMADAVRRHPIAHKLIFGPGAIIEQTIEWSLNGRACTSRPDVRYGSDVLIDLKTTRCAEPGKFQRDALWMGYHAQFAFYGQAIQTTFGSAPHEHYCIAVESKRPHPVTVLELTERAVQEGGKCWRLWWEQLAVCEENNRWPAYTDAIERLDVIDDGELRLKVDGEDFEF